MPSSSSASSSRYTATMLGGRRSRSRRDRVDAAAPLDHALDRRAAGSPGLAAPHRCGCRTPTRGTDTTARRRCTRPGTRHAGRSPSTPSARRTVAHDDVGLPVDRIHVERAGSATAAATRHRDGPLPSGGAIRAGRRVGAVAGAGDGARDAGGRPLRSRRQGGDHGAGDRDARAGRGHRLPARGAASAGTLRAATAHALQRGLPVAAGEHERQPGEHEDDVGAEEVR